MNNKIRLIALYLPQFHPVEVNDKYWGKGFTEWRNVAKAKPLFRGQYQPRIPADLGFYDLRLPEVREAQAEMAQKYGVEGFCYWHYWFGNGKMVLEKPLEEVVRLKQPNFPFCIGWANHSWSNKTWKKTKNFTKEVTFLKQSYPGENDLIEHFNYLLPMFLDERYIKVDGKPLFMIFDPLGVPDNKRMIELWNHLAVQNGLKGLHWVARIPSFYKNDLLDDDSRDGQLMKKCFDYGYDAVYPVVDSTVRRAEFNTIRWLYERVARKFDLPIPLEKHHYAVVLKYLFDEYSKQDNVYPMLIPHWDNTPRAGRKGYVYTHESPKLFGQSIDMALDIVKDKPYDKKIVFIHSWNEWGEGAYLEPDLKYGLQYLEEIQKRVL